MHYIFSLTTEMKWAQIVTRSFVYIYLDSYNHVATDVVSMTLQKKN